MGRAAGVRGLARLAASVAVAAGLAAPAAASAQLPGLPKQSSEPITSHLNIDDQGRCPVYGDFQICSGQVPSWDGSMLDVDVTLPPGARLRDAAQSAGGHPLILAIHGAGGADTNKYELQSTTDEANGVERWRWNSHWFAKHGFYVVSATQRGYRNEGPAFDWQPRTPAGTSVDLPNGVIRLSHREFSQRDEQWLAAQVARSFDVDTDRIATTGRLSGGGESWQLATEPVWTFPHEIDDSLPILRLRVAIPRDTWTDLAYSFAPHGHGGGPNGTDIYESAYGRPGSEGATPAMAGPPKASLLAAVYTGVANRQGVLEAGLTQTPSEEGTVNLHAWFWRVLAGDPDTDDPLLQQVRRGLTYFRSPYYLPRRWDAQRTGERVAILNIQSWTADLFTAVEGFRQLKYLKRLDPKWPIRVILGDVGFQRAQNPPAVWRAMNTEAWRFLLRNMGMAKRSKRPEPTVTSYATRCAANLNDLPAPKPITATTPEKLARGKLFVDFQRGGSMTSTTGINDPEGPLSDPQVGSRLNRCIQATDAGPSPFSIRTEPLPRSVTYAGLGYLKLPYRLTRGNLASVHLRVWDVPPPGTPAPDDKTRLVSRGTYLLIVPQHDAASGTIRIPLFGNHWKLRRGHRLRVDVAQVDSPYFRPLNTPSSVEFDPPTLTLPLAERVRVRVPGS